MEILPKAAKLLLSVNDLEAQRNYYVPGLAYEHLKNPRKSAEAYGQALTFAKEPEQRAAIGPYLAGALFSQGNLQASI